MSDQTTNLLLPYLAAGQAQKHVTVNESLRRLDALVQLAVVSATTVAQPGSPTDGQVYILPAGKTGAAWGAMSNNTLAYYCDGAWEQITPLEGWLAFVKDTDKLLYYTGAAWGQAPLSVSATDRVLGRISSGAGPVEEVVFTDQAQQLCDDASFSAMRTTLGAAGLVDANVFSANQSSSTYIDWALSSGNAFGRVTGRYNIEGGAHDALALSCNYKWDTGARDSTALGTAMVTVKGTNGGEGIVEFWTGAINTAPFKRAYVNSAGLRPATDNTLALGGASERWNVVYAGTGTINTSDAREKTALAPIPEGAKRAVRRIMGGVGVFQWLSSVEAKGDGARLHVGVTAQAVHDAFLAEGEDPHRWALFCEDPLLDGEGQALTRMGLRKDQLFALALAVLFEAWA